MASSIVGVSPPKPAVNWEKRVDPMPMMTASTRTLMPDDTTLPSTRSAMKAVLPNSPKGISTKPASVVSELDQRYEELHGQDEEGEKHQSPCEQQAGDLDEVLEGDPPIRSEMDSSNGRAASRPVCATLPGRKDPER